MSSYEDFFCNTTTDLEFVVPDIQAFDRKIPITGWIHHGDNVFKAGSTGTVDTLFRDNFDLGDAQSSLSDVDTDGEWFYDTSTDTTYVHSSNNPMTHHIVEGGRDYSELKTEAIKRGAEFIRSYLGKPIYKRRGVGVQGSTTRDFEDIIIRCNAIIACAYLVRPYDPDRAEEIEKHAYDIDEESGYLDKIKRGEIRLWNETDFSKKKGIVNPVTYGGSSTGSIINVEGSPSSTDRVKIIIANGGTVSYGSENTSVTFSTYVKNENGYKVQLSTSAEAINGDLQAVGHGMYVQFSMGVYTTNDEWELDISAEHPETGLPKNVNAIRYPYKRRRLNSSISTSYHG
ncbi:MAG: hypothetical protein Unbinned400contig1004_8 [Prokaryotic dsDNA virus sp.]|nr:MAG: hypothetical protein Unbinned400contig1004_8 [Prokaryotic dsDNA virus sp.]|tara:strand:- start:8873 stop:9901 length:1029 start_codon:yes stop_codon:yes gene_type:complete